MDLMQEIQDKVFYVTIHPTYGKWYDFLLDSTVPAQFNAQADIVPYTGGDPMLITMIGNGIFNDQDLTLSTEAEAQRKFFEVLGGTPPHLEGHDPDFDPNIVRTIKWHTKKDGLVGMQLVRREET